MRTEPKTSHWPLPAEGVRVVVPLPLQQGLARHPLCADCMPLAFGYYPKAQGHRMRRQQHTDHLLIYCVAGKGQVQQGADTVQVQAGDLVLLRKGQAHRYQADHSTPWSIYWVHFDGALTAPYLDAIEPDATINHIALGFQPRLLHDFQALQESGKDYQQASLIHAAALLKSMLTLIAVVRQRQAARHRALDMDVIHQFMHDHLYQRLTLDTLVQQTSSLSRYHFCRAYKQATGQSPIQSFLHMKMTRACYLLDMTSDSISHIASRFGYDDPYYFSRLFRKMIGMSPSEYRQQHERLTSGPRHGGQTGAE